MTLLCEPPCIKKSFCSSLIKELQHVSWCTDVALVVYLKSIIYSHSVFSVSSPTSTFSAVLKKMFNSHSVDFDTQFLHLHFKILILLWFFFCLFYWRIYDKYNCGTCKSFLWLQLMSTFLFILLLYTVSHYVFIFFLQHCNSTCFLLNLKMI